MDGGAPSGDVCASYSGVEHEEPLEAKTEAWAAVNGYRSAMTYVLQLADAPRFSYSLDLAYIDTWSLRLDVQILLRTVPVVLTARGAH